MDSLFWHLINWPVKFVIFIAKGINEYRKTGRI